MPGLEAGGAELIWLVAIVADSLESSFLRADHFMQNKVKLTTPRSSMRPVAIACAQPRRKFAAHFQCAFTANSNETVTAQSAGLKR